MGAADEALWLRTSSTVTGAQSVAVGAAVAPNVVQAPPKSTLETVAHVLTVVAATLTIRSYLSRDE